jgi:hypothetical protein
MPRKSTSLSTGKVGPGRPKKTYALPGQLEWDFDKILKKMEESEEARTTLTAMLASRHQKGEHWRGLFAVPPGSMIESVIGEFYQKTNLPLEIPFFVVFSYISGYLLKKGVYLETETGRVDPDIWTVILAPSGAGKTFTQKKIRDALGPMMSEAEFQGTGIISAAAFVEALSEHPRGIWVRDEFAQFLKSISDDNGPMAEMKDYMLRLYDNDSLERRTKKETLFAENPAMSILGLTVAETFSKYVTTEMMLDGFAQRFSYVIAQADPNRKFIDFPVWKINTDKWSEKWDEIQPNILPVYHAREDGAEAFAEAFKALYQEGLPESFYRRILWRAHKYALLYHVLVGDKSETLTRSDYAWAARALALHIDDAAKLVGDHGLSNLERMIQAGERIAQKVFLEEKRPLKPRDLIRGMSAITNVAQAKSLMSVMSLREGYE